MVIWKLFSFHFGLILYESFVEFFCDFTRICAWGGGGGRLVRYAHLIGNLNLHLDVELRKSRETAYSQGMSMY